MSPAGCPHVNSFKVDNWKQNLRVIYQCFVWSGSAETRKRKVTSERGEWVLLRDPNVRQTVCLCLCELRSRAWTVPRPSSTTQTSDNTDTLNAKLLFALNKILPTLSLVSPLVSYLPKCQSQHLTDSPKLQNSPNWSKLLAYYPFTPHNRTLA